jgi:hypothetical protein
MHGGAFYISFLLKWLVMVPSAGKSMKSALLGA